MCLSWLEQTELGVVAIEIHLSSETIRPKGNYLPLLAKLLQLKTSQQ